MTIIENGDRWLTDGDCTKCRRKKFCSKPCKRHKGAIQREITGMIAEAMINTMVKGAKRRRDN